jgi:hypothetical protein
MTAAGEPSQPASKKKKKKITKNQKKKIDRLVLAVFGLSVVNSSRGHCAVKKLACGRAAWRQQGLLSGCERESFYRGFPTLA